MNIHKKIKTRSGFTLIELLTVIAIIGILAGILIPTIGLVRKNANKAKASSNLRQIAIAYNAYSNGPRIRNIRFGAWGAGSTQTSNIQGWAQVLAQFGGLNDAAVYFIESASDVANLPSIPQTIFSDVSAGTENETWVDSAGAISYEAVVQISPNARSVITPLIWTKGIGGDSSTWPVDSPWEGEGGHIAFLDAHVTFYNTLASGEVDGGGDPTGGLLSDSSGNDVDTINKAISADADNENAPTIVD